MKIRTGFVTNSSSSFTSEIIIDNPKLLEILIRYEQMGVFYRAYPLFTIGTQNYLSDSKYFNEVKTPAFHFYLDAFGEGNSSNLFPPSSIDSVLEDIIKIIDSRRNEETLNESMMEELNQKEEEIKGSFLKVIWYLVDKNEDWEHFGTEYFFGFDHEKD